MPSPPQPVDVAPPAPATTGRERGERGESAETRGRRRTMQAGVWVVAVLAAVGGALATGEPTGTPFIDVCWRAGFAALVTLAASRSRRWPCIWLAGVTIAVT